MVKVKPEYLSKHGKREFVVLTVEDFDRMNEAIEDAHDLRVLRDATRKNGKGRYFTPQEVTQQLASPPTRTKRAR